MARRTSKIGNLRAFGSNRFWCYFLVHTFKIKKVWIDFIKRFPRHSKVLKNVSLRASKFWQFRFPVYTFETKKTALDYVYPFLSFSVHNFCARTDGRTDIFRKSFLYSTRIWKIFPLFFNTINKVGNQTVKYWNKFLEQHH